jgi:site-specific DNA-methyltransferase (cytosine-N4-specific)
MADQQSDLPFGSEFSPSQTSLPELLEIVSRHTGNPRTLQAEILETYFAGHGAAGGGTKPLGTTTRASWPTTANLG